MIAYAPPWVYSRVTGIKSPTGVEADGWLLTVGGPPKQMLAHDPEFTYSRLLQAARMAKRMGAQIMGLGAFTKVVGDAGVTVAEDLDPASNTSLVVDSQPQYDLSPYLYMQFMEPLGATDGSVEASWDHLNDRWRPDLVEVDRRIARAAVKKKWRRSFQLWPSLRTRRR